MKLRGELFGTEKIFKLGFIVLLNLEAAFSF